MTKGKFGLSTAAIAVIAFAFAAIGQPVAVLLICGFALLAEKDEWLNKQTMQALLLTVTYYLTALVDDWIFGGLARFFGWLEVNKAQNTMITVNSIVGSVIYVAFIAVCVVAVLRNLRGKDAAIPIISKMSGGDLTAAFTQNAKTQVSPTQYVPPQAAAPGYAPPAQPPVPKQTPSAQTAATTKFCSSCGASLSGDSAFCTECGAKIE